MPITVLLPMFLLTQSNLFENIHFPFFSPFGFSPLLFHPPLTCQECSHIFYLNGLEIIHMQRSAFTWHWRQSASIKPNVSLGCDCFLQNSPKDKSAKQKQIRIKSQTIVFVFITCYILLLKKQFYLQGGGKSKRIFAVTQNLGLRQIVAALATFERLSDRQMSLHPTTWDFKPLLKPDYSSTLLPRRTFDHRCSPQLVTPPFA